MKIRFILMAYAVCLILTQLSMKQAYAEDVEVQKQEGKKLALEWTIECIKYNIPKSDDEHEFNSKTLDWTQYARFAQCAQKELDKVKRFGLQALEGNTTDVQLLDCQGPEDQEAEYWDEGLSRAITSCLINKTAKCKTTEVEEICLVAGTSSGYWIKGFEKLYIKAN